MENASKALIIAGAILLSILIISLGIMIYNQASEVVDGNAMSELEVTQFNSKFTTYMGTNVRGAQVNSLINQVVQNNVSNQQDTSRRVKISGTNLSTTNWKVATGKSAPNSTGSEYTAISDVGSALTGKTYEVSYDTDSKTGLINNIKITANT